MSTVQKNFKTLITPCQACSFKAALEPIPRVETVVTLLLCCFGGISLTKKPKFTKKPFRKQNYLTVGV